MHIQELKFDPNSEKFIIDDDQQEEESRVRVLRDWGNDIVSEPKRVLVGGGARLLFYPTLFYNLVRNRFQTDFRWWDPVDQFVLLGAVPFPSDVLRLKVLGVHGVVTLNEPYETLVPTSLYKAHDIDHLVLPTRDYLFAPSMTDICQAVEFIHRNASHGWMTYVHCKAGRGRSTTIVLCYLVRYKEMTPEVAYSYVRSIRPRVLLASPQWQAVKDYYNLMTKNYDVSPRDDLIVRTWVLPSTENLIEFDDRSVVVVTTTDLDGYDPFHVSSEDNPILTDPSVIYKVREAGQAAIAKLSCLWLGCYTQQKQLLMKSSSCTFEADQIRSNLNVDIHVY